MVTAPTYHTKTDATHVWLRLGTQPDGATVDMSKPTEKAWKLFRTLRDMWWKAWLPKSQVTFHIEDDGNYLKIPHWLFNKGIKWRQN